MCGLVRAREFLSMTALFDHDVVDGLPVALFLRRLSELMESAFGLWDPGAGSAHHPSGFAIVAPPPATTGSGSKCSASVTDVS